MLRIDGDETGTSFKHALGFKERGLKLHQTMYYQKADIALSLSISTSYAPVIEYFVFSAMANQLISKDSESIHGHLANRTTNQGMASRKR